MSLDISLVTPKCPTCCRSDEIWSANITHNLNRMASVAGIYEVLWRPEEVGIKKAKDVIEPLEEGIKKMEEDPEKYSKHNAPNGWGTYKVFLPWLKRYLAACRAYPEAEVET